MGKRKKLQRLSFGEEGDGEKKTYLYSISCVLADDDTETTIYASLTVLKLQEVKIN